MTNLRLSGLLVSILLVGCSNDTRSSKPTVQGEAKKVPANKKVPMLVAHTDSKFAPGQVWKMAGDYANSRLVVLLVERMRDRNVIIHAAIEDIEIKTAKGTQSRIAHLPFARAAVEASVTELAGKAELPPFKEGYDIWREAFEKGEGGVFTTSVGDAVTFVSKALSK